MEENPEKTVIKNLLSGLPVPKTLQSSKSLLLLKHYKLIDHNKNLIVPIIDINKDNELIDFIQEVSNELANKVLIPSLSLDTPAKYNHGIVRLVMEGAVDLLIENKLIDAVDENNHDNIFYKWIFNNYSYSNTMKSEIDS